MGTPTLINPRLLRGQQPGIKLTPGSMVAGGAVRNWFLGRKNKSDIDVYFTGEAAIKPFLAANRLNKIVFKSDLTETYLNYGDLPVQVIRVFKPDIAAVLDCFDYTVCQFGWTEDGVFATAEAITCALRGTLMIHAIQPGFEMDSFRRAFKYTNQGFVPCAGTQRELALMVRGLGEETFNEERMISPPRID